MFLLAGLEDRRVIYILPLTRIFSHLQWLTICSFVKLVFYHKSCTRAYSLTKFTDDLVKEGLQILQEAFLRSTMKVVDTSLQFIATSVVIVFKSRLALKTRSGWRIYNLRNTVFLFGKYSDLHAKLVSFCSWSIYTSPTQTIVMEKIVVLFS